MTQIAVYPGDAEGTRDHIPAESVPGARDPEAAEAHPEEAGGMEIRDKIAECRAAMKRAERLALELDAAMDPRPRSPKLTGMPRSGQSATLDLQMEIIESARKRFEEAREIALEQLNELEEKIDALEEYDQKAVLYFRYIYRLKWDEVAERMHWSERTVRRIHGRALEALAKTERDEE